MFNRFILSILRVFVGQLISSALTAGLGLGIGLFVEGICFLVFNIRQCKKSILLPAANVLLKPKTSLSGETSHVLSIRHPLVESEKYRVCAFFFFTLLHTTLSSLVFACKGVS